MKAQNEQTSLEFKRNGITILIRPTAKAGKDYFVLDYRVKGERKLVWRSSLKDARAAASTAVDKITAGQSEVLELTSADRHAYLRALDHLDGLNVALDHAAHDHAECLKLLAGRATGRRSTGLPSANTFGTTCPIDITQTEPVWSWIASPAPA